ncbi:hypothetical protein LOZ40_006885, partial [Ophidiomyces ophidiicola]
LSNEYIFIKFDLELMVFHIKCCECQAAIQRLNAQNMKAGLFYIELIRKIAKQLKSKDIKCHLHWVPAHMDIFDNEEADIAAKKATELRQDCAE